MPPVPPQQTPMFVLLLIHLALGVGLLLTGDRLGRHAFTVAALAPALTVGWMLSQVGTVVGVEGEPREESVVWVEGLNITLDLRLDSFGVVMTAIVSGIGLLVCIYSVGYFSHIKPGQAQLAGLMVLFAGAMLGVVWADHLIALFVAWELTSITSYLLIGNDDKNPAARAAALQAIFITGAGGLALLLGLIIIGQDAGTYRISELLESPPSGGAISAALVCVLLGAFTKSAQAPFSSWLPGAMVAPTPVSTYLHSATMVKAGVYLVARLSPIFATTGHWRFLVLVVGSATMLIGGLRALRQHDLKLLLAYGTVSQLGFMMLLFGTGEYKIAQAGVVLIIAHAAFKATLFMLVGMIDHQTGSRDVRRLHSLDSGWWGVKAMVVIGAASMAGLPPLLGFIAKEKAFDSYLEYGEFTGAMAVLLVMVVGSIFTFAYSARLVLGVFGRLADPAAEPVPADSPAPSTVFWAPAAVLTVITVAAGLAPVLIDELVQGATVAIDPHASPSEVHLWAGFNMAFALSLVVIGVGTLLVIARRPVENIQAATHRVIRRIPSSERSFNAVLHGINLLANRVAAITQTGSLPVSLLIIFATVAVVPLVPFIGEMGALPQFVEKPLHIPLVAIILGAALGAALVKRRISAVVMLGAVGFAMAGLWEVQGAPDLALTQFAIETLGTVLFVLVLRFLPGRFVDLAPAIMRPVRLAVSALVGAAVFVFAIAASNARDDVSAPNISEEMVERSYPDGKGQNVVNVILVDFRGVDTMGEITVLVVAGVGAAAVARADRRRRREDIEADFASANGIPASSEEVST